MTHDDDGRALDARMAAARPARDPDFDHPEVHAAARALIEELSMTTHVPDAPTPPSHGPGPHPDDADAVLVPAMATTPPATRRARRALAGAAAAAVVLGAAVALAGGRGTGRDDPRGQSVSLRPAAAIRQDACQAATLWLDAGEPGPAPDDEVQAHAEELADSLAEVEAAQQAAEDELAATLTEAEAEAAQAEALEQAAAEQGAAERGAELAAVAAELEALQAAVEAQDTAAVESQVADPDGLGC